MMRQIKDNEKIAVDNCLRFISEELEKRTMNMIGNPNEDNLELLNKDLHAYGQVRILADRARIDSKQYDEKVNDYISKLRSRGIKVSR